MQGMELIAVNSRAHTLQRKEGEDPLRRSRHSQNAQSGGKQYAGGQIPHTSAAHAPRAGGILHMQHVVGNAAMQRMMSSAAPEAESETGQGMECTCPMCKPQRVYTDEPLAPPIQAKRDEGHGASCTCPSCASARAAQAQPVQRWWGDDEQEGNENESSEQTNDWVDSSQNANDSGNGTSDNGSWSGGGNNETGGTQTMREPAVEPDTGGKVDIGLHVAVVNSGGDTEAAEQESEEANANANTPAIKFADGGRVGTAPVNVSSQIPEDGKPHAFVDGGMTGTVVWAGGGGAGPRGNQNTGSIQTQDTPVYDSRSLGITSNSEAWVKSGGDITVTRSWLGANAGDQGNGHYVTAGAAGRFNSHEVLHVNSTSSIYNSTIKPMLERVKKYKPAPAGGGEVVTAFTQLGAMWDLSSAIGWSTAVTEFQKQDQAANNPMKTVDTNDLASGTYPVDRGPGKVGGKDFQHRVTLPSEAAPT